MEKKFMAKQFLRVGTQWTKIADPAAAPRFFMNISGNSIQIQFSKEEVDTFGSFTHPFTVGGLISQIKSAPTDYVYARAQSTSPQGIVVTDTQRINLVDADNYRADIDALTLQVIKLTRRSVDTEITDVHQHIDYVLAMRELLDLNTKTSLFGTTLQNQTLMLNRRLFAAECLIQKFRNTFTELKCDIKSIQDDSVSGSLASLKVSVSNLVTTVTNLVNRFNALTPKVEALYTETTGGIEEAITPLQASVAALKNDFDELNNALVWLSSENTVAEIEAAFNVIIRQIPDNMYEPIEALRDILVKLALITDKNNSQDTEIEKRVDSTSTIIFDPSTSVLLELEKI